MSAVITATVFAKEDSPISLANGSANRRIKSLYLEGPKAAQGDWFLISTYLSAAEYAQIIGFRAVTEDSGNAYAIDVIGYDSDHNQQIKLGSTDVGTSHVFIDYYEG